MRFSIRWPGRRVGSGNDPAEERVRYAKPRSEADRDLPEVLPPFPQKVAGIRTKRVHVEVLPVQKIENREGDVPAHAREFDLLRQRIRIQGIVPRRLDIGRSPLGSEGQAFRSTGIFAPQAEGQVFTIAIVSAESQLVLRGGDQLLLVE